MLKDAFWLMRNQWGYNKFSFVFTILFYASYGGLTGVFSNGWLAEGDEFQAVMVDVLIICFMSSTGFIFSKGYFNNPYWKNDSFTSKLALLRTLPIPVETLALSRLLQILVMSPITTIAFFATLYFTSVWAQGMGAAVYVGMVLCWFAFGNVYSGIFILMEWGLSGKKYLLNTICMMIGTLLLAIGNFFWTGTTLAAGIAKAVGAPNGWVWPLFALLVAAFAHVLMQRKLRQILYSRDFA